MEKLTPHHYAIFGGFALYLASTHLSCTNMNLARFIHHFFPNYIAICLVMSGSLALVQRGVLPKAQPGLNYLLWAIFFISWGMLITAYTLSISDSRRRKVYLWTGIILIGLYHLGKYQGQIYAKFFWPMAVLVGATLLAVAIYPSVMNDGNWYQWMYHNLRMIILIPSFILVNNLLPEFMKMLVLPQYRFALFMGFTLVALNVLPCKSSDICRSLKTLLVFCSTMGFFYSFYKNGPPFLHSSGDHILGSMIFANDVLNIYIHVRVIQAVFI